MIYYVGEPLTTKMTKYGKLSAQSYISVLRSKMIFFSFFFIIYIRLLLMFLEVRWFIMWLFDNLTSKKIFDQFIWQIIIFFSKIILDILPVWYFLKKKNYENRIIVRNCT